MINLEQVKLLEEKVARAIDYIELFTDENNALRHKETDLQAKVTSYQKRIDELELVVMRFKEDQSKIEDSILAALDRLSQFEEAMEKSLRGESNDKGADKAAKPTGSKPVKDAKPAGAKPAEHTDGNISSGESAASAEKTCFEIPETEDKIYLEDDVLDPLADMPEEKPQAQGGELDIF